ncbi:MAG TPA: hypothetical protein VGN12_07035 [Pirellulales bacterium]|jgi:TolB protein
MKTARCAVRAKLPTPFVVRTIWQRELIAGCLALLIALSANFAAAAAEPDPRASARLFFTSQGKTAVIRADGSDLKWLEFEVPNQATWQPGSSFPDGRRTVMLSMEPRRDGPGRPFEEYYTQTPTHIWIYNLDTGSLDEICNRDRLAPFETPALLVSDNRILVQVVKNKVGQIVSMNLDGTDARDFTHGGEGLPYGLSLSPDGRRVAFHLAGPQGYQVWTSDTDGTNRVQIAGHPDHLYFGTSWSPDGKWILYVDCHYKNEPGHDWADVCIGSATGGEHRVLTEGQPMWFAATYGDTTSRGSGSNLPAWTHDGCILYPRRTEGARIAWPYRVGQPDLDHFNRDYKSEDARGGTEIFRLDPRNGQSTALTHSDPAVWDFRASESSDGRYIIFCRAATGAAPTLWVMDAEGHNAKEISKGRDDRGLDHPRWLPQPVAGE